VVGGGGVGGGGGLRVNAQNKTLLLCPIIHAFGAIFKLTKLDLLVNVTLSELTLSGDGPGVTLTFLSIEDGHQVARLLCHGLLAIHCVCADLPLICDVTLEECAVADSMSRLEKIGYGLAPHVHKFLPPNTKHIHFIVMEGGDIDIQIACVRVEVTDQ
jgi:hypothetical protein